MFGDNFYGQCGKDPKTRSIVEKPEILNLKFQVHNVACGLYHAMCIGDRFKIYTWGNNSNGQLGHGDTISRSSPTEVTAMEGSCCLFIACGPNNSIAFDDTGLAYGWGNNSYFKLGVGKDIIVNAEEVKSGVNLLKPTKLDFYHTCQDGTFDSLHADEYMVQVDLNNTYSVGITNKNRIFTWGLDFFRADKFSEMIKNYNYKELFYLKLRHVITVSEASDKEKDKLEVGKIEEVQAGENFTLAKTSTGELLVWGSNAQCQHGTDLDDIKNFYSDFIKTKKLKRKRTGKVFVNISTLPHFIDRFGSNQKAHITSVAVGFRHVVAIEKHRTAYSWGDNDHGELGLGNKGRPKILPTRINSVSGMNLIGCAASNQYSMLLTKEGAVYSFGSNKDGKLGLADKDPKYDVHIPTRIESLSSVKAKKITAGPNHAMALCLKNIEGDDNIFYKLTDEKDSEKMKGNDNEQALLYCWGNGFYGQLGNKKLDNSLIPVQIDISENFKDISCGEKISGAVTHEGKLYLWGCQSSLPRTIRVLKPKNIDSHQKADVISSPVLYKSDELKFDSLSLGNNYHCVVAKSKKLYFWGYFTKESPACSDITEVKTGNSSQKCDQVSVNKDHAVMVFQKSVFTWGLDNFTGRLGQTLEIKDINISRKKRNRVKKKFSESKSKVSHVYNPEVTNPEPTELDIIEFLLKEKNKSLKIKDIEITGKSSTNKTHPNETQLTSISGSGLESQFYEQKINLDDNYLFFVYKNAEKTLAKVDYEMRLIKDSENKKMRYFEKMRYMILKRLTENPYQNIKLRVENSDQNPKQLSSPEKVQLYNALFTGLQLHPCLLVNLVKNHSKDTQGATSGSNVLTKENFRDLVVSVYGSLHGDPRKESLYLKVLEKMLEWELVEDINSEDTHFFSMNLIEPKSENEIKGKKILPYSSLLIDYLVDNDLKFRLALEQIYNFLEEEITEKMKNVERDIRNYVYSFRDDNKFFKDRYASDTSNWKEEEFLKRKDNLVNLFNTDSTPSIIDMIEFNISNFIRAMLKTLDKVFRKKFKDFKNREEVSTLYWGFLIKPLSKIVMKKLIDKLKKSKREHLRYTKNFEDILLFFMHYATSTPLKLKEENKWITELNKFIADSKKFLAAKMKTAMQQMISVNMMQEYGDEDSFQRKKIRQLKFYIDRIMENRMEKITVSLLNVVKVCRIVKKQKFSNELYRGFMNQVGEGDESFTSTNPHYFGNERCFNFTILAKEYILDDFISLRSCSSCDCLAPSAFIEPNKTVKIIQSSEIIKKNSDLDIYMKYLGVLEEEKIRSELKGKSKKDDTITKENLIKKLQVEKGKRTQDQIIKIQKMLRLIEERKNEYEINVNEEDDFLCNNTGESTILEPMFLNLREKTIDQLRKRHQYFKKLTSLNKIMGDDVIERLRMYRSKALLEVSPCNQVIAGKKKWYLYERIYMNLRLGFANWKDINMFEKENKFVKLLRHSIFRQGVSRLIYQNLTKNEKTFITTNFDIVEKNELKELLDLTRFKDSVLNQLMINITVNETEDIVMKLLYKKKNYFQVLEVFNFTVDDVYMLRRKVVKSKLQKGALKKLKKEEKMNNLKIDNNGFTFINYQKLIQIISKAENLSLIYQQIDYLEDNSTSFS